MSRAAGLIPTAAVLALLAAPPALAAPRVVSLDQCADQFVLALAAPDSIAGVSPRADDADSWMREAGRRAPRVRPTLEAVLARRPQVVVRHWGGDARLTAALQRRGVAVVQVEEAADFDGVRANVRRVAAALDARPRGEALVRDMDARLARAEGAWGGQSALYLTAGGWTAGPGSLVEAILRAAGLRGQGGEAIYAPVSIERLILDPPRRMVLGFFEALRADRRGPGRHPSVRRRARERAVASLPGSMLGCPGWFAAEGAERLAAAAPRR